MSKAKIKGLISINGKLSSAEKASIPVLDHGFLYGDSIYETFRTFSGYPFQMDEHLDRLCRSAKGIHLKLKLSKKQIAAQVMKTALAYWKKYGSSEVYIRVIMSRGFGDIGFDVNLCPTPNFIVIVKQLKPYTPAQYKRGYHVRLVRRIRNNPRALDPNIKSGNYLNNVLAYLDARKFKSDDALMENANGFLTEGTRSNLFIVKRNVLCTPSLDSGILKGLTRGLILKTAKKQGIKVKEMHLKPQDLFRADESFFSSSLIAIMPVTRCNSKKIGSGKPGPMTLGLMNHFKIAISQSIREEYCVK